LKSRKLLRSRVVGSVVLLLGLLTLAAQAQAAVTTVVTLRDGRGVERIDVEIISVISGVTVKTGRTGKGGKVRFDDLQDGALYQVQTPDGNISSEAFTAGSTVELELGRAGWNLAGTVGFAVGSSTATFKSDGGLDADESGIGGGPEIGLIVFAPPRRFLVDGVRPFLVTSVVIALLSPDEFKGDVGGVAKVEDTLSFGIGGGVAFPFDLASRTMTLEPSVRYALTASELLSQPSGLDERSKKFTSHAIDLALVLDIPLGKLGPLGMGLDFGVLGHFPISGKATLNGDLNAEPAIDVQGKIGIRGTFEGFLGGR
jgi:hypothetical protein